MTPQEKQAINFAYGNAKIDNPNAKIFDFVREHYVLKAKEIIKSNDIEVVHAQLDGLLCDLLEQHGHTELVQIFRDAEKWYA